MAVVSRLRRVEGGRPEGGQFVARTYPGSDVELIPPIGRFLIGNAAMLTEDQINRIREMNDRMPAPPEITIHTEEKIDLVYAPYGDTTSAKTVRVRMDDKACVVGGGSGELWELPDISHPMIQAFIEDYGEPPV